MITLLEKIEIMEAFGRGEKIEFALLCHNPEWERIGEPKWNWELFQYRIKPRVASYCKNCADREDVSNIAGRCLSKNSICRCSSFFHTCEHFMPKEQQKQDNIVMCANCKYWKERSSREGVCSVRPALTLTTPDYACTAFSQREKPRQTTIEDIPIQHQETCL